jgi:hypothetical protein
MRRNIVRTAFLVGCAAVAWCLSGSGPSAEAQPGKDDPKGKVRDFGVYVGAFECSNCHTKKTPEREIDFVKLTEFQTWRVEDRHSQAFAVLRGERGKRMGELLGVKDVTKSEVGCLGCHALDPELCKIPEERTERVKAEGVGCEACHGPAGGWLTEHFARFREWRDKTSEEKAEFGLRNLRDPAVQTRVCLSCHQGNAEEGKVVTHAMYAAGHPPLPSVEVAGFTAKMPNHWYRSEEVPWLGKGGKANAAQRKKYDYDRAGSHHVRLALVGSAGGLRQSAELLRQRSTVQAQFVRARWPELVGGEWDNGRAVAENWPELAMTHFDCAACHHELERPSWRQQRGYRGAPGRPTLPGFPRTLVPVLEREFQAGDPGGTLSKSLDGLDQVCGLVPFGKPDLLNAKAGAVVAACDGLLPAVAASNPKDRTDKLRILRELCDAALARTPDYDSARVFLSAFAAIYPDSSARAGDKEILSILAEWKEKLDLARDPFAAEREAFMRKLLDQAEGSSSKVNEILVTRPAIDTLHSLNEKSAQKVAERRAAYKPEPFLEKVRALRNALSRER